MKKLAIAAAALLAASLSSGNALAYSANHAKGIAASPVAVKVHYRPCYRPRHRRCRIPRYCTPPCYAVYRCSPCCGGVWGWGWGWGSGWSGFPFFGWVF